MTSKKLPRLSKMVLEDVTCDFCKEAPDGFVIDAPTVYGSWAYMCQADFQLFGVEGMGTMHNLRTTEDR